ncbi:MAG: creatininase family protein, partial [Chloroflexota bacterium]
MTEFFAYEDLTWPDVAALPPDTPLLIPLGEGYDLARLASALGSPPRAGLLPPLPFGWRGSGLAVPEALLGQLLSNLLDSLRDDGFSRVCALTPQGIDLGLGAQRIALPHGSQFTPAPLLPESEALDKVILIPIGHTEQHGYHLPLSTDTLIIGHIGRETESINPTLTACLPV